MFAEYLPIILLLLFATGFAIVMSNVNNWFGPKEPNEEKLSTYESGMEPVKSARERISVKYYMVAILFIVFDIEVVFMYPWAINFKSLGMIGFIEMISFILLLFFGYIYVLKKKVFKWE